MALLSPLGNELERPVDCERPVDTTPKAQRSGARLLLTGGAVAGLVAPWGVLPDPLKGTAREVWPRSVGTPPSGAIKRPERIVRGSAGELAKGERKRVSHDPCPSNNGT